MLKPIKCICCKSKTKVIHRRIRSKRNNSIILMNNAPVYYCPHCKDFIIPLEVIAAFRYIKSQPLIENNINEFSFSEVSAKAKIAF